MQYSQVPGNDMHRRGRIVRRNGDVATRFVARLREFAHGLTLHREVRPGHLHESACHAGHDERKKEWIPLLPVRVDVGHEAGLVHAWRQRIHKVEEKSDDEEDRIAWRDVLEPVRAVVVRQGGYHGGRGYGERLVLFGEPVK